MQRGRARRSAICSSLRTKVDLERGAVVRERVEADVRRAVGSHRHQPSELLRADERSISADGTLV